MTRVAPLALVIVLVSAFAFAALASSEGKVGARLGHYMAHGDQNGVIPKRASFLRRDGSHEETTAIWVMFNAKCASVSRSHTLNEKALARRAKHGCVLS